MSITIVATAGSASANSFATEAEAIAYMAAHLNASTWTTVSGSTCTEDEKAALVEATRELSHLEYIGTRASDTQTLAWPRLWATNPDSPFPFYFAGTVIPARVRDATCELAFQFLKAGTTDIAAMDSDLGVTEQTIDVITTRYDSARRPKGLDRYPSVMRFLRPLLGASPNLTQIIRG